MDLRGALFVEREVLAGAAECRVAFDFDFDLVDFDPVDDDLRRWRLEERGATVGSATRSLRPGATLMPEILFQRRS